MLRYHRFTIGWSWVPEYGSADEPEAFRWLSAYSPLQAIRPGTTYPPTLVLTADHDDRVVPAHSFKFAAALQAAQSGEAPVLIRVETRAGHGAGRPVEFRIAEAAEGLRRSEEITARYAKRAELLAVASNTFAQVGHDFEAALESAARLIGQTVGDGCWIALLTGELYHTVPVAPDGRVAQWSPDGRFAAFEVGTGVTRRTHLLRLDGGTQLLLIGSAAAGR